jgi:Glycosyltransferase family 87
MRLTRYIMQPLFLWSLLCIILIYSILNTIQHYNNSPYNDLRNRVVGARLMAAGESAYFHKWKTGEPETWLDPYEKQNQVVNGNTVTPMALQFFSVFNNLHYGKIKWIWIIFSFACFLGSLLLVWRLLHLSQCSHYWLLLPALIMAAAAWKIHLYSGQVYIFYTLLLVLFFYCYHQKHFFAAGLVALFLIAVRIPFLILFVPLFLIKPKRKMLWGFFTGLGILILVQLMFVNDWQDYFRSMQLHALELTGKIPEIPVTTTILPSPEGIQFNNSTGQQQYQQLLSPDILSIQKMLPQTGFFAQSFILPLLLLLVYLLLYIFATIRKPVKQFSETSLLLSGFVLYILSEYFLPAPRFTYNFVQWIFPLAVLVCSKKMHPGWQLYLLFTGLFFNMVKWPFIPDSYSVGELLMLAATIGFIIQKEKTAENKNTVGTFAT